MLEILKLEIVNFFKADIFVLATGKFIQTVLLFLAVKIFTTKLPDAEVGNLILMMAVTMFIGLALINPVGSLINREVNSWVNKQVFYIKLRYFNAYVFCVSIFTLFVPYFLGRFGIGNSIPALQFAIAISLFTFFNTWNQTIIPLLNILFYRKAFVFFTIASISMYLGFSVFFVTIFEATAFWWLIGHLLGLGLGFTFALMFTFKHVQSGNGKLTLDIRAPELKKILRFTFPLGLATLMLWVLGHWYKLFIESQLGAEALAYIGLALALATSLAGAAESLIMQVFHSSFYRGIAEAENIEKRSEAFQIFINGTIPLAAGAIFIIICIAPFLLKLLVDDRFSTIYPFLVLGLTIEVVRVMTNIFSHAAHSEYKTKKNILPYTVGAAIAIPGIFYSTTLEHWEYCVLASLFSGWLISLVLMVGNAKKLLHFNLPFIQTVRVILQLSPLSLLALICIEYSKDISASIGIIAIIGLAASMILHRQYQRLIK